MRTNSSMRKPDPVRPDVLPRVRELITIAIATRSMRDQGAAAKERGLDSGLQPALPAAAAVPGLLLELGGYQAPRTAETLVTRLSASDSAMVRRRPQPGTASGGFTAWRL